MDKSIDKMTSAELLELEKSLRQERMRRKTTRVSHDMVGYDARLRILGFLTWTPQSADEIAKASDHTAKEVRWVMRTYNIKHTIDKPWRFYMSKEKVSK